jgi:Zinc finger, C2H2 type
MASIPSIDSTVTAADSSPGLLSSPETAVSTRCHTPMDNWTMDHTTDMIACSLPPPITPNTGYWCDSVSCSPEQFLGGVTAFAPFSPPPSTTSSPALPTVDCFAVGPICKTEDLSPGIASLPEQHEKLPLVAPSLATTMRQAFTSTESPGSGSLEQRKKLMEEKTRLVRRRVMRKDCVEDQPKCDICDRTFSRPHNLKSHMEKHNPDTARPYPCNDCEKTFKRLADLLRHRDSVSFTNEQ